MINWPPDRVTTEQFAGRIRLHLGGQGYIFTADVGYEYIIMDGVIYRNGKAVMTVEEAMQMDDEMLVARCKA